MNDIKFTGAGLEETLPVSERVDALNHLAWYLHNRDRIRAVELCREAMRLSQSGEFVTRPYRLGLANAQSILGMITLMDFKLDEALELSLQVLNLLEGQPTCTAHVYVYIIISWINFYHSDYSAVVEYAHECLRMAEELGNSELQAYALDLLGAGYGHLGDAEHALENHARAMQIAEEIAIPDLLMVLYNNLADRLCMIGNYAEARKNVEKAMQIANQHGLKDELTYKVTFAEILLKMEAYDLAEQHLHEVLSANEGTVCGPWVQTTTLILLASLHIIRNQIGQSETFLQNALELAQQNNFKIQQMACHQMYVDIYEKAGHPAQALAHYKQVYALQSEILGTDKTRKATLLQAVRLIESSRREAEIFRMKNEYLEQRVQERTADLRQINSELEMAVRARDEFLAAVSHELRTPLTVILGTSQMLLEDYGRLDDVQEGALAGIRRTGMRLNELVTDVLDYSRLQSGKYDLHKELCFIDILCATALQKMEVPAARKKQKMDYFAQPEGLTCLTDPEMLAVILKHLLGNASKFTPEDGGFGIRVMDMPEQRAISLTVWDMGIGIARTDFERIFEPFVQLDARLARRYEGTGLGLALVRKMVLLLNGQLQVQSEVGEGSRFTLVLPCE